jgi:hypothetical protein
MKNKAILRHYFFQQYFDFDTMSIKEKYIKDNKNEKENKESD